MYTVALRAQLVEIPTCVFQVEKHLGDAGVPAEYKSLW